jgi:hypothetical protein
MNFGSVSSMTAGCSCLMVGSKNFSPLIVHALSGASRTTSDVNLAMRRREPALAEFMTVDMMESLLL